MIRALLLTALLVSCGGGGGSSPESIPEYVTKPVEIVVARPGLFMGYYLTFDNQIAETADHVNLVHEGGWFGVDQTIASMRLHGKATMLDLHQTVYEGDSPRPDAEGRAMALFDLLQGAGVLHQVVALYPIDEPQVSSETVEAVNAAIRRAASHYPQLSQVKLAVIYDERRQPCVPCYDWIGMTYYSQREGVLTSALWTGLAASLRPDQRTFLVPAGGDPFQQDPEPFRRYAHSNPQVIGILPFMWAQQHPSDRQGIGANGMAPAYRAMGREILSIQ